MNEAVWYYARGDSEKGPITTAQIKALAAAGKIRPDDFVWKDGMENWALAREVAELFPGESRAKLPSAPVSKTQLDRPEILVAGRQERTTRAGPATRPLGQISFATGVFLVLLARGCDALSQRNSELQRARLETSQRRFEEDWQRRRFPLEAERQRLVLRPSTGEAQRIAELDELLAQQIREADALRQEMERDVWSLQRAAAHRAEDSHRSWEFWRASAFLLGSLTLVTGLLALSLTSQGPERWVSMAILGAIVCCTYLSNR